MGTDINGWVEIRRRYEGVKPPYDIQWYGVIMVASLVDRNYDMFSSLFGVTGHSIRFTPVAPGRSLPLDISEEAGNDYLTWDDCVMGETWISWMEIQEIDWDEEAVDGRPHEYVPDGSGGLVFARKSAPSSADAIVEGNTWQVGESVFRVEKVARRESLRRDWQLLFRLMEDLAAEYGDDSVRMVVWFDY